MDTSNFKETQWIELATAEGFFALYNSWNGTSYAVWSVADHQTGPDVLARNAEGDDFNLEITLTEDRPGDIAAALGRSDHHSLETFNRHLQSVRSGKEQMRITSLERNALPELLKRVDKKLNNRYGPNTALVIRDAGLGWDWEPVLPSIRNHILGKENPFSLGIWLLSLDKRSLTRIDPHVVLDPPARSA